MGNEILQLLEHGLVVFVHTAKTVLPDWQNFCTAFVHILWFWTGCQGLANDGSKGLQLQLILEFVLVPSAPDSYFLFNVIIHY